MYPHPYSQPRQPVRKATAALPGQQPQQFGTARQPRTANQQPQQFGAGQQPVSTSQQPHQLATGQQPGTTYTQPQQSGAVQQPVTTPEPAQRLGAVSQQLSAGQQPLQFTPVTEPTAGARQGQRPLGSIESQGTTAAHQELTDDPPVAGDVPTGAPAEPGTRFEGRQPVQAGSRGQVLPQQAAGQVTRSPHGAEGSGPSGQVAGTPRQSPAGDATGIPQAQGQSGKQMAQQFGGQTEGEAAPGLAGMPSVDVYETTEEIVVHTDVPGCSSEDVDIRCNANSVTINAERSDRAPGDASVVQLERPTQLERTFALPSRAEIDEAEATVEDGECEITLPKAEEAKEKRIGIQ